MHSSKLTFQFLVIVLLLTCMTTFSQAKSTVEFSWAVLTDTTTGVKPLNFSPTPKLKSGTTLQIYIEQKPGAFIYIYLTDSTGGLSFIFPGDPRHYDSTTPTERIVRIPPNTARFKIMPPDGQEKFYLLASPTKLAKLEQLTAAYMNNDDDTVLRANVIKELKLLHRKHSSLAQKTETSVPVAGTVRTRSASGRSFDAVQVKADGVYSRILRINHD